MKTSWIWIVVLQCLCTYAWADAMFSVTRYEFCRTIAEHEPKQTYSDPTDIKKGESLFLWMEITVNKAGLRYLRSFGRLPVIVAWGRDGRLVDKPTDIGIRAEDWTATKDKIMWKYTSSGNSTFTWRTQAMRTNLASGQHYVSVLDPNRKPVVAVGGGVDAFRPSITINEVRR